MEYLRTLTLSVWHINPKAICFSRFLGNYWRMLSKTEKERYESLVNSDLKRDFLIARALVRTMLSSFVEGRVRPDQWNFLTNKYGRPVLDHVHHGNSIHFNLSHTDGLISCVVGPIYEIGIDVEFVKHLYDHVEVAESCFSSLELRDLKAQPLAGRPRRFFEYWTLKEAYIKARGMGLSLPLDKFWFHIVPNRSSASIGFDPRAGEDPGAWRFQLSRPTSEHQMAISAKAGDHKLIVQEKWITHPDILPSIDRAA